MQISDGNVRFERYMEYVRSRPELFAQDDRLRIILNPEVIFSYEQRFGTQLGVVYESPYNVLIVDLVEDADGKVFPYERLIPASTGESVVAIPHFRDKFILIEQYRHAIRRRQLAFPRGYGEDGLSVAENACKELGEEIGATVRETQEIGEITPDSGLSSGSTSVVVCEITDYRVAHEEGIVRAEEMTREELRDCIAGGRIDDAFTLSAFALYDTLGFIP